MKENSQDNKCPLNGRRISEILRSLSDTFLTSEISISALKDALSGRTYGILLLVLAFPNLIPIPAPGLSAVLGAPLILLTFQLMFGIKTPWLPKFIANRTIKREQLQRACARITPYLDRLDRITTPRLQLLVKPPAERFIAFMCVILSLIIMMPVPFGNTLPALAICFFALGILQRDGLLVIFGIITAILGIMLISAVSSALYLSFLEL